jgi:starch phosphorylase
LNGFSIGGLKDSTEEDSSIDSMDSESLYNVLENEVIPAYYAQDEAGMRTDWIRRMRQSLATLTPEFSSDRMVRDYIDRIYLK